MSTSPTANRSTFGLAGAQARLSARQNRGLPTGTAQPVVAEPVQQSVVQPTVRQPVYQPAPVQTESQPLVSQPQFPPVSQPLAQQASNSAPAIFVYPPVQQQQQQQQLSYPPQMMMPPTQPMMPPSMNPGMQQQSQVDCNEMMMAMANMVMGTVLQLIELLVSDKLGLGGTESEGDADAAVETEPTCYDKALDTIEAYLQSRATSAETDVEDTDEVDSTDGSDDAEESAASQTDADAEFNDYMEKTIESILTGDVA